MNHRIMIGYDGVKQKTIVMVTNLANTRVVTFYADAYKDLPTHKFLEAIQLCIKAIESGLEGKVEGLLE